MRRCDFRHPNARDVLSDRNQFEDSAIGEVLAELTCPTRIRPEHYDGTAPFSPIYMSQVEWDGLRHPDKRAQSVDLQRNHVIVIKAHEYQGLPGFQWPDQLGDESEDEDHIAVATLMLRKEEEIRLNALASPNGAVLREIFRRLKLDMKTPRTVN